MLRSYALKLFVDVNCTFSAFVYRLQSMIRQCCRYDSGIIIPLKTTIYVYYWTRTNLIISNYISIVFGSRDIPLNFIFLKCQLPRLQRRMYNEAVAAVLCGSVRFDYRW